MNKSERWLINLAALVVVLAGIKSAGTIIVPLLVAIFVALVSSPIALGLQRRGVPTVISVLLVLVLLLGIIAGLSAVVGGSVNAFRAAIPTYEGRLVEQLGQLTALAAQYNVAIDEASLRAMVNPNGAFQLFSNLLAAVGGLLTNGFLILLIVVFVLIEAASMPDKVRVAFNRTDQAPFLAFGRFMSHLNKYMLIKTIVSALTGILAALYCTWLGIDFPIVLGLIAFLLNYIPTLG